jgi:tetratricopeptide (TPR) repeat protein
MPLDTPEYDEFVEVMSKLPARERPTFFNGSREEALRTAEGGLDDPWFAAFPLGWQAGEFRRARELFLQSAPESEGSGRIALAVGAYAMLARCHNALGDLDAADGAYEKAMALSARLAGDPLLGAQSVPAQQLVAALDELRQARGTQADESVGLARGLLAQGQPEIQWARASIDAAAARILAITGQEQEALAVLETLSGRLDRIPPWDANNTRLLCDAAHALWALQRTDHLEVIERNLREKVIAPDFRYPMFDGRQAMARLCALSGRHEEAVGWFQKARDVLDEQGARPLRAIVDYDEALLYVRRGAAGDAARAAPLVEAALSQFREIGMLGWISRAEELKAGL